MPHIVLLALNRNGGNHITSYYFRYPTELEFEADVNFERALRYLRLHDFLPQAPGVALTLEYVRKLTCSEAQDLAIAIHTLG